MKDACATWTRAALFAAAGLVIGCRHAPRGPSDVVGAFALAVERKDYDAAYRMMSDDYRRRVTLQDFRAELDADASDTATEARKTREAAPRVELRTELEMDLGERLPLVMENGAWRVDRGTSELWGQGTPRAALRLFVRSLERKRYDVVERLVPARYREAMGGDVSGKLKAYWEGERAKENQELLRTLRANIGARIVENGDEAYMPYGVKSEVRFVRESGAWKIDDPD